MTALSAAARKMHRNLVDRGFAINIIPDLFWAGDSGLELECEGTVILVCSSSNENSYKDSGSRAPIDQIPTNAEEASDRCDSGWKCDEKDDSRGAF